MKKLLAMIALALIGISCNSDHLTETEKAAKFQKKLNKEFADSKTSPLPKDALKTFESLDFFPIQEDFIVTGKLLRTPGEKPFEMPTTTSRKPTYIKFGEITFTLADKTHTVDVFQDLSLKGKEEYTNHLFLPFTDLSSGETTYGGGRYLDLEIPEGDEITINFNMAYNPYCTYNPKYSCPIPPDKNFIKADIYAGVKDYQY
ncbi:MULTISPECIES: DUF1684 domain-containing protein [Myroides]|uniref:DUF1684 domain-containing protein n=1 Tax=Myroides albus TaxID=2562892 RepID=A0A6I3LBE7_9FLAO|nr:MULTISPECIES: DUF1684 domain-containing protein [Myroides]MTG96779.1 DUF1684 domain-containing protein [Myroides albus]MVX36173.1 DUF1684 domain-containing protein [Myroides sp. LoEW2-1]UVD80810.1 DUF1684 domain-containing protein [Myroides albus]